MITGAGSTMPTASARSSDLRGRRRWSTAATSGGPGEDDREEDRRR
jgi:hypothetical protein